MSGVQAFGCRRKSWLDQPPDVAGRGSRTDVRTVRVGIRERASVSKARIHDLRHTFSAYSRESGMAKDHRMAVQVLAIAAVRRALPIGR